MGTNYYLQAPKCFHCGKADEPLHLGKSSGGWCFSLHVYPEEGINNWDDLQAHIVQCLLHNHIIVNEYGDAVSFEEFKQVVENRHGRKPVSTEWLCQQGGYGEPGPNNLVRHTLSPGHCIGQGKGTYDYLIGEFF